MQNRIFMKLIVSDKMEWNKRKIVLTVFQPIHTRIGLTSNSTFEIILVMIVLICKENMFDNLSHNMICFHKEENYEKFMLKEINFLCVYI